MDEKSRIPEEDFTKETEKIENGQDGAMTPDEQQLEGSESTCGENVGEAFITARASAEGVTAGVKPPTVSRGWARELYEWTSSIAVAVVLALIINQFFFALVQVDGRSMEPTLYHGERLVVRKILYTPARGDIVILKSEAIHKYIVKRVVALPGQTVDFDDELNTVVDGITLDEPYIMEKQQSLGNLYTYPLTVPKKGEAASVEFLMAEANLRAGSGTMSLEVNADGSIEIHGSELVEDGIFEEGKTTYKQDCYFVMGDNRNHSSDSRTLGLIPESEVVGKASFRLFPFSRIGRIN